MTNKTRKHLWPVSLVMSIGIIGALAAFLVLGSNPGDTQAHGAGDHPNQSWPACADMTDAQRAIHNGIHENIGSHGTMDPCPTPRHRHPRHRHPRYRRHDYIRQHQWRRRSRTQGGD